jgi:hypothetical protein
MADEKDRFGEKIKQREKAQEDQWARQQDAELLQKIRQKAPTTLHCPRCGNALIDEVKGGIHLLACPQNDGAWIEASALESLLKK